jgi:hypothetical protein
MNPDTLFDALNAFSLSPSLATLVVSIDALNQAIDEGQDPDELRSMSVVLISLALDHGLRQTGALMLLAERMVASVPDQNVLRAAAALNNFGGDSSRATAYQLRSLELPDLMWRALTPFMAKREMEIFFRARANSSREE